MAILTDCPPQKEPAPALTVAGVEGGVISVVVDAQTHQRTSETGSPCNAHAQLYDKLKTVRIPSSFLLPELLCCAP